MKRLLAAAMLVVATTSLSTVGATVGAQAKFNVVCKAGVSGKGVSASRFIARRKARMVWRKQVVSLYGSKYANFSKAKVITFKGSKQNGKWRFRLFARPCKSLGFKTS